MRMHNQLNKIEDRQALAKNLENVVAIMLLLTDSSTKIPQFNYTFTYGNQTYQTTSTQNKNNTIPSLGSFSFSLWEVSANSVFVIPVNSILIAAGLRLLFCKIQLEAMKISLIAILFLLYVTSMIGMTLYASQTNQDLFKQNFFLQYIILTISLVLGFLTEIIAILMMAYYFMKVLQVQIKKISHLYLVEQHENYLKLKNKSIDASQQSQRIIENANGQAVTGIVNALNSNQNLINNSVSDINMMDNSQIELNLSSDQRMHNGIRSIRESFNSSRNSQLSGRNPQRREGVRQSIRPSRSHRSNQSSRSNSSQIRSGIGIGRNIINGIRGISIFSPGNQPGTTMSNPAARTSVNNRSNPSTFTFIDQRQIRGYSPNQRNQSGLNRNGLSLNSNLSQTGSESSSNYALRCSICTIRLISNIIKIQGCNHMYHKNCLVQWRVMNQDSYPSPRRLQQACPTCIRNSQENNYNQY
ncbi:UNKNOWN [Stylonychia lemnae]|uniref:RING-type domain-containing protein n=1 Tax=Stylonychia lemnae TaxID=5949 RepID=A0A078ABD9_STYLE|nr:UNKNOWN [Stylonychia lemnae]|eukprot:CDW79620.1 UNKNOWN [Stylonychia lemnae]